MYIFGIIFLPSDHGPKSRKKLHVNQYYFYALRWLHVQQFDHILDLSSFLFERLYFSMSTTTPVIICNIIKSQLKAKVLVKLGNDLEILHYCNEALR